MARSSTRGGGPGIISRDSFRRGGPVQFFKETISELRKAVWPSREETVRLTYIVIILAGIAALALSLVDYVLGETFRQYVVLP